MIMQKKRGDSVSDVLTKHEEPRFIVGYHTQRQTRLFMRLIDSNTVRSLLRLFKLPAEITAPIAANGEWLMELETTIFDALREVGRHIVEAIVNALLLNHAWRVARLAEPQRCKEKWQQGGEVGRIKANGSPSDLFNMSLEAYPNLFRFCAASLRPYSSPAPNALAA